MTPLAVRIFYIRREHFGASAGIHQFTRHLDPARVFAAVSGVEDGDGDLPNRFPLGQPAVRRLLRRVVQRRGQQWYNLSDLAAEASALGPWVCGRYDLLHYLDGEHTAQYLPAVPRRLRARGLAIATYHQPAAVLPQVVAAAVVRRLDHVTVVAESQLEYLSRVLPPSRLSVVYYGVDTDFFRPPQMMSQNGVFRCVSVGSYLRDWALLSEIARLLRPRRDVELHVVSAPGPPFDEHGNVTVHRAIDDLALRTLYARSHLAVLPLLDSTANNALLEAMAMGLPVVVTDLPSIREYAPAGAALRLPRDPEAFVRAITALAADPARRAEMGQAGRTRAESLAWPVLARAYEALYERLA
jgi:glycosyltransferase involved in cell wall biosynthesis